MTSNGFRPVASQGLRPSGTKLKLGPYEHLRETTVKDFILSHQQKELLLAALLLCAILVHVVRVNWLVNRRTEELKFALAVQRATERKARENRQKLDLLEKSRVISRLNELDFCPRSQTTDHKPDLLRQRAFPASAAAWGKRRQGGIRLKTDEQPG